MSDDDLDAAEHILVHRGFYSRSITAVMVAGIGAMGLIGKDIFEYFSQTSQNEISLLVQGQESLRRGQDDLYNEIRECQDRLNRLEYHTGLKRPTWREE